MPSARVSLVLLFLLLALPTHAASSVVISEFMASNTSGISDENGDSSDWIELFNAGNSVVNLAGWRLTDDAADKNKFVLPSTNIPPNGFLLVWASAKNRAVAGAPLHANFSLSGDGEYLALIQPDDSIATEFNPFPNQYDNIAYGTLQQLDVSRFILTNSAVKYYVPSNNALGLTWTGTAFSDAAWKSGTNGLGYEQSVPGFAAKLIRANGTVGSLTAADSVISTPALQLSVTSENRNVINYFNSGGTANYTGDIPFPGMDFATDIDNFVLEATGTITIPSAGAWTFGVNSDDGFRLVVGSFTMSFPDPRGPADTLATFNFASAGEYPVRLVFYEQGGGSGVELFAAQGTFASFNSASFRLVGDTAAGGLAVRSAAIGQSTLGYRSFIHTDVQSVMYNKSPGLYVRYPFNVANPASLSTLTLQVKSDDGFVAYLNGTRVASRNGPAFPTGLSNATGETPDTEAIVPQTFDLTATLGLLASGANTLAIHGLNLSASDDDFLFAAELAEFRTTLTTNNYLTVATPAAFNSSTIYNKVADTKFSHDRGFYETNFNLTISSATPGATIRYTIDGTIPTLANGNTYSAPIAITGTTTLRAAAFKTGMVQSDVDTHTYLFTRDIITQSPTGAPPAGWPSSWGGNVVDYGMDPDIVNTVPWRNTIEDDLKSLPVFSVVMKLSDLFDPTTGIYANPGGDTIAWERPCSLELIHPDGKDGFHENCGIRIRGGFSRSTSNPKHALRFFFRQEYGASKLRYPVFGSKGQNPIDKFDLRTTQNYSWAFQGDPGSIWLRDQFSRDTQLDMGQPAERGNWFHLYINGQYWGLFNSDERAEASFGEAYFGGREEDYDTIKVGPDQGYTVYATDGTIDAWQRLWNAAVTGFAADADYFKIQGLNVDGTPNPTYENLLDVPNLIDYMLVIIYGGNLDAPISAFLGNTSPNNFFAIRNRTGLYGGFRFLSHDAEHTLLNVNEDRSGPFAAGDPNQGSDFSKSNPQYFFSRLAANAEFRMLCADRIQKHFFNGGALTVSNAQARLDARTNEIWRALVPESARWGDSKRNPPIDRDDFLASYNNVRNNYIPARGNVVLSQLRADGLFPTLNAPSFSQLGGFVPFGYSLFLTNNNATGTIYYTLDGTDPRLRGGAINPGAVAYAGPIVLNTARTVRARVKDGAQWSAIVEATFYPLQNFQGLVVSEIMFNPPGNGATSGDEFEFIELKNVTANNIDLSGLSFTDGITYTFPNGAILAPNQFYVLVRNTNEFKARYPSVTPRGIYTGRLDNGGELLRIKHALGGTVFTLTYDDDLPWPVATDGQGFSLVQRNPSAGLNPEDGLLWRASSSPLGSPGADDPTPTIPNILINEALAHTDPPDFDSIELLNPTASSVNIGGWYLSDDPAQPQKFRIPSNTTIAPNGYLVFTEADFNANPSSTNSFLLGSTGDSIVLSSADGAGNLTGYSHGFKFGATQNGTTLGRYINSQGEEHFTAQKSRTLGAPNSGPLVGPVVINEIQYHPDAAFDEFVELQNITSTNVPLFDPAATTNTWKLAGLNFTLPQGVTLPPGGFLVVSAIDPAAFRARYSVPAAALVLGPYSGGLQDSGERIQLLRPDSPNTNEVPYIITDEVRFNDKEPWPVVADGSGPSLQRKLASAYGNDPTNWFASGVTPGRANTFNQAPTVSLTSPANGAAFLPPANIVISANASDSDGAIAKVEFYANGNKLGEDTSAPYSFTWSDAPAGTYSLTAKAFDIGFAVSVSDPVNVIIYAPTPTTILPKGYAWKYLDTGVYPGANWTNSTFNDAAWATGNAQFGYGDGDETTVVGFGPNSASKYITTWFRSSFNITNLSRYLSLTAALLRDDGGVVYLNGKEVFRSNLPDGTITDATPAQSSVGGGDETSTYYTTDVPISYLREGLHSIAVEIHQSSGGSSDISFDLELTGTLSPVVPTTQLTSPSSGSSYTAPTVIPMTASAADPESGIARVDFYAGNTKVGSDNTAPYTFDWSVTASGPFSLFAVAINNQGLSRTSAPVSISIIANLPPTVALTSPTNNTILKQPASVTLTATASDPDGGVSNVAFYVDQAKIADDSTSPYSATWASPTLGAHNLFAVATDSKGISVTSSVVVVTITNVITVPVTLVSAGSAWKYNDQGLDLGTTWQAPGYNDSSWPLGASQFGYSTDEADEISVVSYGSDSNNKYPTYYFRRTFTASNIAEFTSLTLDVLRDDGVAVYINGVEVFRDNLQTADIVRYTNLALVSIGDVAEKTWITTNIPLTSLTEGLNTLAVEVHQQSLTSSDLSFDLALTAVGPSQKPTITLAPQPITAQAGERGVLAVGASGNQSLSYQWYRNDAVLPGATNAWVLFPTLGFSDQGQYGVVISSGSSGGNVTSSVARVSVTQPDVPPAIAAQPSSLTVKLGDPASFSVTATGTEPLTYQWRKGSQPLTAGTNATFTLATTQSNDAGGYDVIISNIAGSVTSVVATLTIQIPPSITQQPTPITVISGRSTNLTVSAQGTAPLSYQWRKNSEILPGATGSSLNFNPALSSDNGSYDVVVTNPAGSITSIVATVTVLIPPAITTPPQDVTVLAGQPASFTVVATGSPTPAYQWRKNGSPISGALANSLVFPNTSSSDAATYDVIVANAAGSITSSVARLTVRVPVTITQQPQNQAVPLTGSATFTVGVSGDAPITYQWFFNGTPVSPSGSGPSLTLLNVQTNMTGPYQVIVSNPYGSATSIVATLTVTDPDTDGDGMPDWWEDLYALNKSSAIDASQDKDGDGMSNLDEYNAGTNPNDPASLLALSASPAGGSTRLRLNAMPSRTYTIQYRDQVDSGPWTKLVDVPAATQARVFELLDPQSSPRRFYRVVTPATP